MGIVRVIKQNELQGGNSEDPIYPVTSTEAIYDLNNKKLSVHITETESNMLSINNAVVTLSTAIGNVEQQSIQNSNSIGSLGENLEVFRESVNNQLNKIKDPTISFLGIISGASDERAALNAQHNFECSQNFNTENVECIIFDVDNTNPGDAWFITKPGEYKLNGNKYNVTNLSVLQCVSSYDGNKTFSLYDLGIPFIPVPNSSDAGKTLKVAEDMSLYWD